MDALDAYALLREACLMLDRIGDHAIAAYVGHGMALLEVKYGIDPDAAVPDNVVGIISPAKPHHGNGNCA